MLKRFLKNGVTDCADTISGNFFKNIPEGGDMYFLKSIIHNLSDNQCIHLLKVIKSVLHENGKILIFEPIVENNNHYSFAKLYDIQMFIGQSGGKERTLEEFTDMIEKSGLKLTRIIQTATRFQLLK